MKYYDSENKKLLYFLDYKVEKNYWDKHWSKFDINQSQLTFKFNPKSVVNKITQRFLHPKDGIILEGGCGLGDKVFSLKKMNYDITGIDTAELTINIINKKFPELNLKYGDVREVPFPNNYFIGYWSLGVIEHFYKGYFIVAKEMHRVLKPKGYLFLTFPYMSPFRKFKARFHLYKLFNDSYYKLNKNPKSFYQYILNLDDVMYKFKKTGFKLMYKSPEDGIKGFKDENFIFKFYINRFLKLLYQTHKPKILRLIRRFLDIFLSLFSAHMVLLVFQKK